jgi:hypothetical protein
LWPLTPIEEDGIHAKMPPAKADGTFHSTGM